VVITRDAKFHVLRKQFHVLLPLALQSLHYQVNIVLSINGVHTLTNIVITNSIQIDLVSWVVLSHGIATTIVV
jgi:hypothetical protein